MKHITLVTSLALAIFVGTLLNHTPVQADDALVPVYLGTYTGGQDGAKGIYLTRLNPQDGSLTEPQLVAEVSNPAFLAKHPALPRLYAVTEQGRSATSATTGDGSPVHAFAIDPSTFALTKLNEQSVPAFGACHLGVFLLPEKVTMVASGPQTIHEQQYAVVVAYYNDGAVASLPLSDNGELKPWVAIQKHTGSGPTSRQTKAFAHAVYFWNIRAQFFSPSIVVPDLGADKLFLYQLLPDGRLAPQTGNWSFEPVTQPGSGPRHAALSESARTAFILNELSSTICVLPFPRADVILAHAVPAHITQTISTLPEGTSTENNTTAEIFMHPNGRFLYASNRGHDSIALFHFDPTMQQLKFIETTPCGGKHPRSFDLSPDGKWLIVAAMQDDLVTTFRIDPDTGRMTPTGHSISVKQPACVLPVIFQ